jgi:hypothetical protein
MESISRMWMQITEASGYDAVMLLSSAQTATHPIAVVK